MTTIGKGTAPSKTMAWATKAAVSAVLLFTCFPAAAQMDPTMQAQGMVLMGQNQGYIDRANGRSTRSTSSRTQVATSCRKYLPVYRQQYGADHPQVVKLQSLCRKAGY